MDIITPFLVLLMCDLVVVSGGKGKEGHSSRKGQHGKRMRISKKPHGEPNINRPKTITTVIKDLLKTYEKKDPPTLDRPTEVKLGIYVNSFYSISEQTMDYRLNFYLRQKWLDPRLQFTPFEYAAKSIDIIKLEQIHWTKLWMPDTFLRNEKSAFFHDVTRPNRLVKLNYTGEVWYVSKISATLSCPMKLHKYPLDTQKCEMMFESFGYTMDTVYFNWLANAIDLEPDLQMPQYTLKDKMKKDCSQNYTAGAFPCLSITFLLRRDIGYFLIQVYIPSMLIVILSWVAFWINIDAIPARVSLGLLTVLTMTTQSSGARSSLPRVSYIKAIDVWMSMCLIFVFASLLEFAVVNVISRKEVRTIKPVRRPPPIRKEIDPEGQLDQINIVENGTDLREPPRVVDPEGKHKARKIDKVSRKVFPVAFMLFNIVYWIMYTIPTEEG